MASFSDRLAQDSPVLTMSPWPTHQTATTDALSLDPPRTTPEPPLAQALASVHQTAIRPLNGRKRSRDEAGDSLLLEIDVRESSNATPDKGIGIQADGTPSQRTLAATIQHNGSQKSATAPKPMLRTHKSQRLQGLDIQKATAPTGFDDRLVQDEEISPTNSTPSQQPMVDHFTLQLGVGWRGISDDEHIQAAARGWGRFVGNHYPVTSARIVLESKGLQSYLVEATEGYYLFSEDLRHGRLVSKTAEGALINLSTVPPTFDGESEMTASDLALPTAPNAYGALHSSSDVEMGL